MSEELIKSYSYDEQEILRWILKLHCNGSIDLDPTYSKGNFYKDWVNPPKYRFDLNPQIEGVLKANAEAIPLESATINSIMFDPPFLATTGKSLILDNDSNKINKRFTVYPDEKSLFTFYTKAMVEFYRLLKYKGVLIFKCQDKVSSGIQYISHLFILNEAIRIGFYCKDIFLLLAKQRIVADWQLRNQKNARKFHSYFIVFEKSNRKVNYCNYPITCIDSRKVSNNDSQLFLF